MTLNKRDQEILERYLARRASWDANSAAESSAAPEPDTPEPISVASGDSRVAKQGDLYVISDVVLYGLDGQPHTSYERVLLDGQAITETQKGKIVTPWKTQPDWLTFHQKRGTVLPSLPLVYAILEAVYDNQRDPVAEELKQTLEADWPHWLATSTRFNYKKNETRHNVGAADEILITQNIPGMSKYLDQLVTDASWERPLRAMFMAGDLEKIPRVMGMYDTRKGYLWTPSSSLEVDRAAFVGFGGGYFFVIGGSLGDSGRSRGVGTGGAP